MCLIKMILSLTVIISTTQQTNVAFEANCRLNEKE